MTVVTYERDLDHPVASSVELTIRQTLAPLLHNQGLESRACRAEATIRLSLADAAFRGCERTLAVHIDERAVVLETLLCFKRAGADLILTDPACDSAAWLRQG